MDEKLQKQLIRQLKILNFWITTLGVLLLGGLVAVAFLLFQVVSAIQTTTERLQSIQQKTSEQLDVKKQLCGGESSVSRYLSVQDFCRE